mgnify:CR=1 FL=1
MNLKDAVGKTHQSVTSRQNLRIVSLVPSITELLVDLGLAQWIVGRTGFCIHPAESVQAITKVGGTKDVNIEKIRALNPSHLVVNIDENEKTTVEILAQFIPNIIVTHPIAPRDNLLLYRLLGGIFAVEEKAEALCLAFEDAYTAVATLPDQSMKNVLYCIWKDPWMTVSKDTYIAQMLAEINWHQCDMHDVESHIRYPQFMWSSQLLEKIDVVLLSTEPYRFNQAHIDTLMKQVGKPVLLLDGEMISWYGSRAIRGLHYLQQLAITSWR